VAKKYTTMIFCSFLSSRLEFKSEILQMYLVIMYVPEFFIGLFSSSQLSPTHRQL